jgi:glycosyltransferase involved in cell wall biosynthesis
MKVLLIGHACGPHRGSEPGVIWNWAWHLSAHHEVWVIAHPQYRAEAEDYLDQNPNPNLNYVWVELAPRWDPWNPAHSARGARIRLHYLLWQRKVFRVAARLHQTQRFDLIHHVSWNTISSPPRLWRLPAPFIWGPVGGGMTTPAAFRRYFGKDARKELLRTWRVRALPYLPSLRRAARHASLLLATNRETAQVLKAAGAQAVRLMFDNGLTPKYLSVDAPRHKTDSELTLVWAGGLEPRKALRLGLEALARVKDEVPARLLVAGSGPQQQELEDLAAHLGLADRVRFLGYLPWLEMTAVFRQADAFLFTSLRDSSGSVVWEAMAHGLPALALDHQGVGTFVPSEASIKVPVTDPEQTVAALAQGIRALARSPQTRRRMGEAALAYAKTQAWDRRAELMSWWYEKTVDAYRCRRAGTSAAIADYRRQRAHPDRAEGGQRIKGGPQKRSTPDQPLVSIITVVRNGARTLEQTILSVLGQSYRNIEYIIVDGASTDGTLDVIRRYEDRLAYWMSEPDMGISDAFNKGIAASTGEIIGLINADDWYEPDAARKAVLALKEKRADIVCGAARAWDGDQGRFAFGSNLDMLEREMSIIHATVFARRKLYETHGLFSQKYRIAMDYDFVLRCKLNGAVFWALDDVLANTRLGGISTDRGWIDGYRESYEIKTALMGSRLRNKLYFYYVVARKSVPRALKSLGLSFIFDQYLEAFSMRRVKTH